MQTGDEVPWPGLDVLNIFGNSGQDLGRSFPDSAGILMLPERYDTMDTGSRRVSLKVGVEYMQLGFMKMAPGNATDPGTSGIDPLSNDIGIISFYPYTFLGPPPPSL